MGTTGQTPSNRWAKSVQARADEEKKVLEQQALMEQKLQEMMYAQQQKYQQDNMWDRYTQKYVPSAQNALADLMKPPYDAYRDEVPVLAKRFFYKSGHYYTIIINRNDSVYLRVYRGNYLTYLLHKLDRSPETARRSSAIASDAIPKQSSVEVTIGLAHNVAEKFISKSKEHIQHKKFVRSVLNTNPKAMKMIADLDKIDNAERQMGVSHAAQGLSSQAKSAI